MNEQAKHNRWYKKWWGLGIICFIILITIGILFVPDVENIADTTDESATQGESRLVDEEFRVGGEKNTGEEAATTPESSQDRRDDLLREYSFVSELSPTIVDDIVVGEQGYEEIHIKSFEILDAVALKNEVERVIQGYRSEFPETEAFKVVVRFPKRDYPLDDPSFEVLALAPSFDLEIYNFQIFIETLNMRN